MGPKNKKKQAERPKPAAEPGNRPQVGLSLLVFTAGAVLMGLEIAGSRVLAPHFGNSVFVWGSLISVFLMALSVGYYVGGHLADRHPSRLLLNSICAAVALLIFGIAFFSRDLCTWLAGMGLGEQTGPLVASMLLFLPPSVGMGVVSPFAIRLATESVDSVGSVAGRMYALSTMGSIAGTLLTTFVLVPMLGLAVILKGLALVLLLTAVLTVPFWRRTETLATTAVIAVVAFGCAVAPAPQRTPMTEGEELRLDLDTPYHHISVVDSNGRRMLCFDQYIQSSIELKPPHYSLSEYTYYFHLGLLARPDPKRTLFLGGGGGVGPRAFHLHDPAMEIDMVDIDAKVLEIAYDHFHLEETPKIRSFAEDGRMFLRKADEPYDCIVMDAFTTGGSIPFHLVTREFLELCRAKMTDDGVFVMNINSAIEGPLSRIFQSMHQTIDDVFANTYVFQVNHPKYKGKPDHATNIVFVATVCGERISPEQWQSLAAAFETNESSVYIFREHLEMMAEHLVTELPDMSGAPIFTDDYAPIETMPFALRGK